MFYRQYDSKRIFGRFACGYGTLICLNCTAPTGIISAICQQLGSVPGFLNQLGAACTPAMVRNGNFTTQYVPMPSQQCQMISGTIAAAATAAAPYVSNFGCSQPTAVGGAYSAPPAPCAAPTSPPAGTPPPGPACCQGLYAGPFSPAATVCPAAPGGLFAQTALANTAGTCQAGTDCQLYTCAGQVGTVFGGLCAPTASPWLASIASNVAAYGLQCGSAYPPPPPSNYSVRLSLVLNTTLAQFDAVAQQRLRAQIAVAAGLTAAGAGSVGLSVQAAGRRRLLAGTGIQVNVTVAANSSAVASTIASQLTQASISNALLAAGLPAATVTSPATVVSATVVPVGSMSSASPGRAAFAAAATAAALLCGLIAGLLPVAVLARARA